MSSRTPSPPDNTEDAEGPSGTGTSAILVVDDEPMIRELAQRTLERNGLRVYTAAHGKRAITELETHEDIGVVLLDLSMPGLTGEQTFGVIRARWPKIRVILTSGYAAESTIPVDPTGRTSFIEKPYLPYELVTAVRDALAR